MPHQSSDVFEALCVLSASAVNAPRFHLPSSIHFLQQAQPHLFFSAALNSRVTSSSSCLAGGVLGLAHEVITVNTRTQPHCTKSRPKAPERAPREGKPQCRAVKLQLQSWHCGRATVLTPRGAEETRESYKKTGHSCERADHKLLFRQSAGNPSAFFMRAFLLVNIKIALQPEHLLPCLLRIKEHAYARCDTRLGLLFASTPSAAQTPSPDLSAAWRQAPQQLRAPFWFQQGSSCWPW